MSKGPSSPSLSRRLIVRSPFGGYEVGEVIEDVEKIEQILQSEHAQYVVRI